MSNNQMNYNEPHMEKVEEANEAQKNIEYFIKNINNNPLIQQFIQDNMLNSKQTHRVNFQEGNLANMEKEKFYDTFIAFQNFLEMINHSSKNLDFMFHSKLNDQNQININSNSNEENLEASNSNYNHDDVVTYQIEKKSETNNDEKIENAEEINFDPVVNQNEIKKSLKSERNAASNNSESKFPTNNEDECTRMKTNDMKIDVKNTQYDSEISPKKESISASATKLNSKYYDEFKFKSENHNINEKVEKNLEIAKYEIIDDKSDFKSKTDRKVKKVQLKKNMEFPKPIEYKSAKSSSVPRKVEEPKQIKKITAKFNFKKNYSSGKNPNEKVPEETKKKSSDNIEKSFKHYDNFESEQPEENRPSPYTNYRSGSVEKIKSNSNSENLLITTESSLKKLLARKSNQPSFNNQNAEEVHKQEEVNEILNVSQQGGRQENRPDEIEKNNPNLSNKSPHIAPQDDYPNGEENLTPNQKLAYYQDSHRNQNFSVGIKYDVNNVDSKNKSDSKREINLDHHSDSLEAKRNPPIMTIKREDVVNEEIVEELEEEELSGLVNYEYLNDDISKKSNYVENSNIDNSHYIDNNFNGESGLGQSRDLFSSKIIDMTNELIRLKGENEKVLKMKSEYHKLTRKLKLELEDLKERREKEFKRLKAESDEFEERRDRELKKLKLDAEEFYERRERELREIEEMREEEMKKIQREKKQLERNIKLNLSIGNRRDKEEIESLKAQISKLQEDHRFKDNTNKLLIDRLRKQLEDANAKITLLNKTIEDLKGVQKKRNNFSTSSLKLNRNKSVTKSQPQTLRKTASVKEISTKPKESANLSMVEKKVDNPAQINYKTVPAKKKVETPVEDNQTDHNSSNYDLIFLEKYHPKPNSLANKVTKTDKTNDGKIIKIFEDGRREIIFSSGVRKEVHLDGYQIVYFTNNDIKQTFPDGKSVYFFKEAKTTQTNHPNGLQVFKFENGQIEKHHPDGSKQITFPDGTLRCILEDGYEETLYPDGSIQKIDKNGVVTIEYEDGIKEIKYPDGREIIEYPEGKGKRKNSD